VARQSSVEKEEFWRLALQEHSRSGLTIKAFCLQQGISQPSFYAWRRIIKDRDQNADVTLDDTLGSTRLIPVNLVPEDAHQQQHAIASTDRMDAEICTPAGFTLRVGSATTPVRVTELLTAITSCQAGNALSSRGTNRC
jgi:hypothetical protein